MRSLYKYPQQAFPYDVLVAENARRSRQEPEFELADTGVFAGDRYFDITTEYAKASPDDVLVRFTIANRGPDAASLRVLPTVWFRNTWSWTAAAARPHLQKVTGPAGCSVVALADAYYGDRWLYCDGAPELLFTENVTNTARLYGTPHTGYVKDGINAHIVDGRADTVNPAGVGTKAAAHYVLVVPAGGEVAVRLRLCDRGPAAWTSGPFDSAFDQTSAERIAAADAFYATVIPQTLSADGRLVMRQALAGLLWSKQFYHYVMRDWLKGDSAEPAPPAERLSGRNQDWLHLYNADVISMPDKWEYPWYAAWDTAFHCVPLALVDATFAKQQLVLLLREWYMHPNGELPAYEWGLGEVNPPVHAWAAWRVYKIDQKRCGSGDRVFLERVFQKLLLNFT